MEAKTIKKYQKKSVPDLKKTAKKWFNQFIRLRDTDENGWGNCISSGKRLKYGTANAQAGHYYSGGHYPPLEFHEMNVHLQGKSDNYFKSGNLLEYRKNLIDKIGIGEVENLDLLADAYKRKAFKQDRFFLIEVIETYKEKAKQLAKTKNFEV